MLWIVFSGDNSAYKDKIRDLEQRVELLNEQKEQLSIARDSIAQQNVVYLDSILMVNEKLEYTESKRNGAINYYEKRLRDMDLERMSADEHVGFFTDRYNDPDTKEGK